MSRDETELFCDRCGRKVEVDGCPYRAICPSCGRISLHRTRTADESDQKRLLSDGGVTVPDEGAAETCPACGADSGKIYRCTECGADLAWDTGSTARHGGDR